MLPEGFILRMQSLLGEEYAAFSASFDRPLCTGLRLNPLKTGFTGDLSRFSLSPVPWCPTGYVYDAASRPGLSSYHAAGLYYLQEPSAMAPAELLDPQPGERVLDLCAAPGGKSTQLAGKLQGRGLLVCNEINAKRAKILAGNIERLGIANALVLNEHPKKLETRFEGYFDKILVDAPCSGEGMFRKEEAAVTDWTEDTNAICANRQSEILTSAAKMLRPGGRLVYSTCTFSPVENECVISDFLWRNPDFSVENRPAPDFSPGRPDWVEHPVPGLEHTFRLWPHKLRGEGHYAAVLKKAGDAPAAELLLEPAAKTPAELTQFCRQTGAALPEGKLLLFGQVAYLVPQELPEIKGLRVLRAGLELGQTMKNRFEPAHAWALWLKGLENSVSLAAGRAGARAVSVRKRTAVGSLRLDARAGGRALARLGEGRRYPVQESLSEGAAAPGLRNRRKQHGKDSTDRGG